MPTQWLNISIDTLRRKLNGCHFTCNIFVCKHCCGLSPISMKLVPGDSVGIRIPLITLMAWRRTVNKSLSEPKKCQLADAYMQHSALTHWGRVIHICVGNLAIIGSDNGLSPGHYLNQWWNIVNWTLKNKHQWDFNRNSYIFIQENAFENVVWKMAAILSRPQWVNGLRANKPVSPSIELICSHIQHLKWVIGKQAHLITCIGSKAPGFKLEC